MQHKGVRSEGICHLSLPFAGMQVIKEGFEPLEDLHPVLHLLHLSESGGGGISMRQTHKLWLRINPVPATPPPALIQPFIYAFQTCNMQSRVFVLRARVCVCVSGWGRLPFCAAFSILGSIIQWETLLTSSPTL